MQMPLSLSLKTQVLQQQVQVQTEPNIQGNYLVQQADYNFLSESSLQKYLTEVTILELCSTNISMNIKSVILSSRQ